MIVSSPNDRYLEVKITDLSDITENTDVPAIVGIFNNCHCSGPEAKNMSIFGTLHLTFIW